MWPLLLLPLTLFAQTKAPSEEDLSSIRKLEDELPSGVNFGDVEEVPYKRTDKRNYESPVKIVTPKEIIDSGVDYGVVPAGKSLIEIRQNKTYTNTDEFYGKFYRQADELGYKYLINKDGSTNFKIHLDSISNLNHVTEMYEPPLRYTPAPEKIIKPEFDEELRFIPEATLYLGAVQGDYMSDLLDDEEARRGFTIQAGAHIFTQWKYPVKAGGVLHLEQTYYYLRGGNKLNYSALSFGPQFKSKDFDFLAGAIRFQGQVRVSPFAQAFGKTDEGRKNFSFNSADCLLSMELPVKNSYGDFIYGIFVQYQWLNLKNQTEDIRIQASNQTNKSFGLSFGQVFE